MNLTTTTEKVKPLIFCLDKSNNSNLKQCLYNFTSRFFTDGKSLIKNILLNKKTEFLPSAIILTGDCNIIKDILNNSNTHSIKTFLYCQNSTRQTYEPFMIEPKFHEHLMGIFLTTDDLKYALEDALIEPIHHRQLIRFITDNLDSYLWYQLLKETSLKIPTILPKQSVDASIINRQIEYDPLITLYTLRSSIRQLSERTNSHKKIFYGAVIKKDLIEKFQSNIDNLISFNSFVSLQGYHRSVDARHYTLQSCSRRSDEVSVIFELESADQTAFKIIRIFNSNDNFNLWVIQLIGTQECVKLSKQFSYVKRNTTSLIRWEQPEILFGQILMEMNEIQTAYRYFFDILINQYDQLSKIYLKAIELWVKDGNYKEAAEIIANEFRLIKSTNKLINQGRDEITYMESELDSNWESPIALLDASKVNDLLAPISYRVDQVLCGGNIPKASTTTLSSSKRRCTLF